MSGKVVVITGANGGLGRALAKRFGAEGEKVVLLGRTLSKVQEVADTIGENALAVECDVTSPDSIRAAFAEIAKTHPKIDVLINNAAVFAPFQVEEASDHEIINAVLTNLAGPILCVRSAVPMMDPGATIINVSTESVDLPFAHLTLYQSTKAGLENFSRHYQSELDDKRIRVTTVRAGQMTGEGSSMQMGDPERVQRFFVASMKRGMNMIERGVSNYNNTTQIFRTLLDLPPDVRVSFVGFHGRPVN